MEFRNISLKDDYLSELDDVVSDFYVPVLQAAVRYDRIAGYFNSGSLAAAFKGISQFIRNEGRMRLICSPNMSSGDIFELQNLSLESERQAFVDSFLGKAIDEIESLEDLFLKDHMRALAWMIQHNFLELKIAIPVRSQKPLMHVKQGIAFDAQGEAVLFKGSINETAAAWTVNSEQFDVWTSWQNPQKILDAQKVFESYWGNSFSDPRFQCLPISEAIRRKLLKHAPLQFEELKLDGAKRNKNSERIVLRQYQEAAVDSWKKSQFRGFFEMATGSGKTRTAHACIQEIFSSFEGVLCVVTVPFAHIADQWALELEEFSPLLVPRGANWKDGFQSLLSELHLGIRKNAVVVAVQNTASSAEFVASIDALRESGVRLLMVADECHGLGAPIFAKAMTDSFDFRLGLSATPARYRDEVGTARLDEFFGQTVYVFTLQQALELIDPSTGKSYLCPYEYTLVPNTLNEDEIDKYREYTQKAFAANGFKDLTGPLTQQASLLLIQRALIAKKARSKLDSLRSLIEDGLKIQQAIIYCEDTEQLDEISAILDEYSVRYHRFTGEEGTRPKAELGNRSERETLIENLGNGSLQCLLAIKCLDEGVDVPSASLAILLASTGNPREFIQRRGRVLRRTTGKTMARILYFVVVPQTGDSTEDEIGRKIFAVEIQRMRELVDSASNKLDANIAIAGILQNMRG